MSYIELNDVVKEYKSGEVVTRANDVSHSPSNQVNSL